ncbi:MAG: hypothetical protein MJE77_09560 [Proteobacteria bacterium]|nr:hypothetical protein [Pseudomonadota bacterium]
MRRIWLYTALLLSACAPRGEQTKEPTQAATTQTERSSDSARQLDSRADRGPGLQDSGRFQLYLNEDVIGSLDYKLGANRTYSERFTLSMAGQTVSTAMDIATDDSGRWQRISLESPSGQVDVERRGNKAVVTHKEKSITVELTPGAVLFSNSSPALLSHALQRYDSIRGGKQVLSAFILPRKMADLEVSRKDAVKRTIAGRDHTFERYAMSVDGVDFEVWVDAELRVYLLDVPAQHAAFVRDGYELLRTAQNQDPHLSRPEFEIAVDRDVKVPTRDGSWLSTTIYRPKKGADAIAATQRIYHSKRYPSHIRIPMIPAQALPR